FPGAGMIVGLLIAVFITYRKDRVSKPVEKVTVQDIDMADSITEERDISWNFSHTFTVIAIFVALTLQLATESLVLGALSGIIIMFLFRVVKFYEGDRVVNEGIGMMGMIAFVMLVAAGYAHILTEKGAVDELVEKTLAITGDSSLVIAILL